MKLYTYNIREMKDSEYQKWYSLMNDERKKRIDAFRSEDDRKRSVAGEMLARKAIAEKCNISAENIIFDRTRYGKPFAVNSSVRFNISHAYDIVVCAADEESVGIDVEKIRPVNLRTAKKVFTAEEINYLFGHTPSENEFTHTEDSQILNRFFELWTKNEAVGKCLGTGLIHEENYDDYSIETFCVYEDYIVSVCQRKK